MSPRCLTVKFILVISCLLLTSCAMTKYTYKNKSLTEEQISRIRQTKANTTWVAFFSEYQDLRPQSAKKDWVSIGDHFFGFPNKLNMLPGPYRIQFYCSSGSTMAFPIVDVYVEAGKIYAARCFSAVENKVGVEVTEASKDDVYL